MKDRDPRDALLSLANQLADGTVPAQALTQAVADLLPSISESEARLIREAIEAAYQLGRLHA